VGESRLKSWQAVVHHQKPVPTGQLGELIGKPTGIDRSVRHSLMDGSTGD